MLIFSFSRNRSAASCQKKQTGQKSKKRNSQINRIKKEIGKISKQEKVKE